MNCYCVYLSVSALGMGLCIAFIALVRLPSLKVSTLLLVGLLIYDVFWVCLFHILLNFLLSHPFVYTTRGTIQLPSYLHVAVNYG